MKPIRLLVSEKNSDIFLLAKQATQSIKNLLVIGRTKTLEDALEKARVVPVDLIIADISRSTANADTILSLKIPCDIVLVHERFTNQDVLKLVKFGVWYMILAPVTLERIILSLQLYNGFWQKREHLTAHPDQTELDALLLSKRSRTTQPPQPSVGNPQIQRLIMDTINQTNEALSSQEIAEKLQMSRITVRKYCESLVQLEKLNTQNEYQSKGRPIKKYVIPL